MFVSGSIIAAVPIEGDGIQSKDKTEKGAALMKGIDEDIKKGSFQPVYLLYGEESYLKKQYGQKLKHALVSEEDKMNTTFYEGKGIHPGEIIDLAETLPFCAERRLIFIENS